MMESIKIIKIGGNVVDNSAALTDFLSQVATIAGRKILVHGGGKIASTIGRQLGIEPVMIGGRRVTDSATLDVVTMVYGGKVNKNIVAQLLSLGVNAVGLTGVDGALVRSVRRASVPIDYGQVGDPKKVNVDLLKILIDNNFTPIVAPLTIGQDNEILNTNADTMAQTVATAMVNSYSVDLIYTFELEGVMDKNQTLIEHITPHDFEILKADGTVSGGMLPKIENALAAVASGVNKVMIGSTVITNN
ncbi:MAG: acetylglutamate kinase [Mucinivorans sp.]